MVSRTCPCCGGAGTIITNPVPIVGARAEWRDGAEKIKIPAVDNGTRLRTGAGHAGVRHGGLYISISVRPHRFFVRKGQDIHLTVPIGLAQAALGVELEVPTLEGTQRLAVPAGTRSGTSFRLPGRGVASLNRSGKGDQVVTVEIDVPRSLSPEQREALRRYANISNETVENIDKSLMARLKRAFGRR